MSRTKKGVNPIDQEIQEELTKQTTKTPELEEFVNDEEDQTEEAELETFASEENQPTDPESVKEIVLPKRYILSECIYRTNNPDRGEYDFGDFLLDLETFASLERVFPERLMDFGIDEKTIEDQNLLDSCIVWSSAFAEEIIILDFNFEELTQSLVEYRETAL